MLCFEIRLVLLKGIVPLWVSAIAIDVVSVVALHHVLKDEELAAFWDVKRLQAYVLVKHLVAVLFVFEF